LRIQARMQAEIERSAEPQPFTEVVELVDEQSNARCCSRPLIIGDPPRCIACQGVACERSNPDEHHRRAKWASKVESANPFDAMLSLMEALSGALEVISMDSQSLHERLVGLSMCRCERLILGTLWCGAQNKARRFVARAGLPFAIIDPDLSRADSMFRVALNDLLHVKNDRDPDGLKLSIRRLKALCESTNQLWPNFTEVTNLCGYPIKEPEADEGSNPIQEEAPSHVESEPSSADRHNPEPFYFGPQTPDEDAAAYAKRHLASREVLEYITARPAQGLALLGVPLEGRVSGSRVIPTWDRTSWTLSFGGAFFRFPKESPDTFAVLDAFQSAGWPRFPERVAVKADSETIRDLVYKLNAKMRGTKKKKGKPVPPVLPICFKTRGSGVTWEPMDDRPAPAAKKLKQPTVFVSDGAESARVG
jgi:hypothetical protein